MGVTIRDYQPSDEVACLGVFNSNIPKYFAEGERQEYLRFLRDKADRQTYLVLEQDQEIVGCGGYYVKLGEGWGGLTFGMVEHSLHGTGLGKRLLLERLNRLVQIPKVEEIYLDTSQHTAGFFERLGFITEEITLNGYWDGLDRYDMKLALDEAVRARIRGISQEALSPLSGSSR